MKKVRENAIKAGKALGLSGLALVAFVNNALAAVPAAVTTAMTDMQTDSVAVATGFLVCTIAVAAFLMMKRGAR